MRHPYRYRHWLFLLPALLITCLLVLTVHLISQASRISRMQAEWQQAVRKNPDSSLSDIIYARMTDREKIGQLLMVNYYGWKEGEIADFLANYPVGGFMLKGENIRGLSYQEIKSRNEKLLNSSGRIPLILSIDQEGGDVARLDGIIKSYPAPASLYREKGEAGISDAAVYFSARLADLSIGMNFSPVIDLSLVSNSVIDGRSFSADPALNTRLAELYGEKASQNGIIWVPKHYPGYGTVTADPHRDICRDDSTSPDSIAQPFFSLPNAPAIMTAHVIFSRADSEPATLSRALLGRLRDSGFSNVIITDDIQMKAITKTLDYREASLAALNAGCDIVLSVTLDETAWKERARMLFDYLLTAYHDGRLPESRVKSAVKRVFAMKKLSPEKSWGIMDDSRKPEISRARSRSHGQVAAARN